MAAPTAITVQQMLAPFAAVGAGAADFTVAASTITDGDTFVCTGRELLFVQNTDAGATTITITSVVDEKNMVIVMSPSYPFADVLVEYLSNPQQDNDYQIEVVCQEALIAFIKWKFKMAPEREYYTRMIEARRKLKPIRLQEIQQAIRQNQKYCLKA